MFERWGKSFAFPLALLVGGMGGSLAIWAWTDDLWTSSIGLPFIIGLIAVVILLPGATGELWRGLTGARALPAESEQQAHYVDSDLSAVDRVTLRELAVFGIALAALLAFGLYGNLLTQIRF